MGDSFAGRTFAASFGHRRVTYEPCGRPKSEPYERLEPVLNSREIELPDLPVLIEQL